jgi:hypothetical protein
MKHTTIVWILLVCLTGWTLISCPPEETGPTGDGPTIGGCEVFPSNNIWNTPVDDMPVDPNSDTYIATIGPATSLHPDFGTEWEGAPIGIPYVLVDNSQPMATITYTAYGDESDPGRLLRDLFS